MKREDDKKIGSQLIPPGKYKRFDNRFDNDYMEVDHITNNLKQKLWTYTVMTDTCRYFAIRTANGKKFVCSFDEDMNVLEEICRPVDVEEYNCAYERVLGYSEDAQVLREIFNSVKNR